MTQQHTLSHLQSLPVIDLSLADGGPEDRRRLHDELRAAATASASSSSSATA